MNQIEKVPCDEKTPLLRIIQDYHKKDPKTLILAKTELASRYFQENLDRTLIFHVVAKASGQSCLSTIVDALFEPPSPGVVASCVTKVLKDYSKYCGIDRKPRISSLVTHPGPKPPIPRYELIYVGLRFTNSCDTHTSLLLVDNKDQTIDFYDPNQDEVIHSLCTKSILSLFPEFKAYEVNDAEETCMFPLQRVASSATGGSCWLWSLFYFAVRLNCGAEAANALTQVATRRESATMIIQFLLQFACYVKTLVDTLFLEDMVSLWKLYKEADQKRRVNSIGGDSIKMNVAIRALRGLYFQGEIAPFLAAIQKSLVFRDTPSLQLAVERIEDKVSRGKSRVTEASREFKGVSVRSTACCPMLTLKTPARLPPDRLTQIILEEKQAADTATEPYIALNRLTTLFETLIEKYGGLDSPAFAPEILKERKKELLKGVQLLRLLDDAASSNRIKLHTLNLDLIPQCARYWPVDKYVADDAFSFIEIPDGMRAVEEAFRSVYGKSCQRASRIWFDPDGKIREDDEDLFMCCPGKNLAADKDRLLEAMQNILTDAYINRAIIALKTIANTTFHHPELWPRVLSDMFILTGCVNARIQRLEEVASKTQFITPEQFKNQIDAKRKRVKMDSIQLMKEAYTACNLASTEPEVLVPCVTDMLSSFPGFDRPVTMTRVQDCYDVLSGDEDKACERLPGVSNL